MSENIYKNGQLVKTAGSPNYLMPNIEFMKLLWENPDPTADFAAQTLSVNLTDYDFILLRSCVFNNGTDRRIYTIVFKGDSSDSSGNIHYYYLSSDTLYAKDYVRTAVVNSNGVVFSDAREKATNSTNASITNNVLIPYEIYGGKLANDSTVESIDSRVEEVESKVDEVAESLETFTSTVSASDWTSNTDTSTKDSYPYICTISTSRYTADSRPIWDCCGTSETGIPTEDEQESISLVTQAYFDASGVTLYATDQPSNSIVFRAKGV